MKRTFLSVIAGIGILAFIGMHSPLGDQWDAAAASIGQRIQTVVGGDDNAAPKDQQWQTFTATVVDVHDGDTITVRKADGDTIDIRFREIDAPEVHQQAWRYSRKTLASVIAGNTVTIYHQGHYSYDRLLGYVYYNGINMGSRQVRLGAAWQYDDYSNTARLAKLEQAAREHDIGLWSHPDPIPPWVWRHTN